MHSNVVTPRLMHVVFQRIAFDVQKELATQFVMGV
jgi:hypothetical protein